MPKQAHHPVLLAAALALSTVPATAPGCSDAPAPADPAAILWEPDLATAQARAAATGRPVLAYFTFDT